MRLGDKLIFNAFDVDQPCKFICKDAKEDHIHILCFRRHELTREEDLVYYIDIETIVKCSNLTDNNKRLIEMLAVQGEWLFIRSVDYYFRIDYEPYTLQEMLNDLEKEIK